MGSHTPLWFWECSPTLLEVMPLRLCDWAVEIERDEMRKLVVRAIWSPAFADALLI
jgi:hypothetical protein